MNSAEIINIITTVGFPIVMCGIMAWYVKYRADKSDKERERTEENHKEEMDKITEALNNNTIALTKLCEKLEK